MFPFLKKTPPYQKSIVLNIVFNWILVSAKGADQSYTTIYIMTYL